jgi:hypothetical protein
MNQFALEEKLLITDITTMSMLFSQPNGADCVALYFFYYKTAKLQRTNQVRATELFCRTGLSWGVKRFREAFEILKKLDLVQHIKSGEKWYIKINYFKRNSAKNSLVESEPNSAKKELVASGTQMLSNNKENINALSFTNVKDDNTPKRRVSCPLLINSSLKQKYPRGHIECTEYITSFKFVNLGKQYKFLHQMLRAGLDFPDIDNLIIQTRKNRFYQENGWDFASLAGQADRRSNAVT